MQQDLQNVISWSMVNNVMLHEDKFVYLRYETNLDQSSCPNSQFMAELVEYTTPYGHVLSPSEKARDLEVYLSADYKLGNSLAMPDKPHHGF